MKKLLLSLLTLAGAAAFAQAEEVKFDFQTKDYGFSRNTQTFIPSGSEVTEGDVKMTFTSNGSGQYLYTFGVRFIWNGYGAYTLNIPEGYTITNVSMVHDTYGTFEPGDNTGGTFANSVWTKDEGSPAVSTLKFTYTPKNNGMNSQLRTVTVTYEEAKTQEVTVVNSKDFPGLLTVQLDEDDPDEVDATITLNEYSDGTYGMYLEDFGGMGAIDVRNITRDGNDLSGRVDDFELMGGALKASIDLTGTYDDTDLDLDLDIMAYYPVELPVKVKFTTKVFAPKPELTFRRLYTDGSSRYYNNISYTVNGDTKVVYSVDDPSKEDYYVTPIQNSWQTEGAYIDFTDKVIEVPADAENFTMILKSNGSVCSSKWSQNAILIDWNNNGVYNEEGETNGVINIEHKANATENGVPVGGLVVTESGDTDVITLPKGLENGQTFSMLITMTEPKGTDGRGDLWDTNWEWTKEIFADGVCSLINGQAYELTVRIVEPLSAIDNVGTDASADAPVEYFTLEGVRVAADSLTPGIYVARQGNKAFKVLVK